MKWLFKQRLFICDKSKYTDRANKSIYICANDDRITENTIKLGENTVCMQNDRTNNKNE